jgi:hypothetical protein
MAFDITRIEVGPARIFLGVSLPTSGAPPSIVTHTAGVPGSGTEVGLTEGDTVVEIESQKNQIMAEQFYAPVEVYLTVQNAKISFTAKESTIIALRAALDNIGQSTSGTEELFYFGSGSGAFACLKQSVFLSARRRDNPAKYIVAMLYSAYASKPLTYTFSRTKEATYPVELSALAVVGRTAGDCIGQFYRELG